jgi:HAE1 family hydrophobic/amphiphilic exporter-1
MMSLLVSFTLIPTVAAHSDVVSVGFRFLNRVGSIALSLYRALLHRALLHKKLVIVVTLWLFGLPVWLLPDKIDSESLLASVYDKTFGSESYKSVKPYADYILGGTSHLFFAKVTKGEVWDFGNQTYLVVYVGFPQGTEIERYDQIVGEVEKLVLVEKSGIEKVTARVQADNGMVRIDIADSAANTSLPFELKNRLIVYAAQTGGATISVSGFGPGFYSGGESAPSFYVKVFGYNYNKVKDIAEEFRQRIERNPRVAEVDIDRSFGRWNKTYELVVTVDRGAISRHGLTVVEVIRAVRSFARGAIEQSRLNIDGERVPYTIKFAGYRDYSTDDLRQATIVNQQGERVRLNDLIGIEERRVPSQIQREDQQYLRLISFEYKGPYRFGDRFVDATIKTMPLPSGYLFDRSFSYFWLSESSQMSLLWIALFALIIVFMITSSLYESFIKPFVIILSVPSSLIGLFLAFYLADAPFGRGGYAAIVLLVGIVVTNSIVVVDYISKKVVGDAKTAEALVEAASVRIRPVLMTTLTTIGGLLPLLIMGEKTSIWYSLSLGTIGGMVSSTVLTLLVVPVVYAAILRVRDVK